MSTGDPRGRCLTLKPPSQRWYIYVYIFKKNFSSHKIHSQHLELSASKFRILCPPPSANLFKRMTDCCPWKYSKLGSVCVGVFYDRAVKLGVSFHGDSLLCAISNPQITDPRRDMHSPAHPFGPSFSSASPDASSLERTLRTRWMAKR